MYSPASWYSTSYYKKSNNYLTTFMVQTLAMAFGILKSLASSSSGAQAEPASCHQSDHRHSLQMEKVQRCSFAWGHSRRQLWKVGSTTRMGWVCNASSPGHSRHPVGRWLQVGKTGRAQDSQLRPSLYQVHCDREIDEECRHLTYLLSSVYHMARARQGPEKCTRAASRMHIIGPAWSREVRKKRQTSRHEDQGRN